jgi:uncharacterized ubiquitin-like protein YukD
MNITVKHAKRNFSETISVDPYFPIKEVIEKVKEQMNLTDYEIKLIHRGKILSGTERIMDEVEPNETIYCVSFKKNNNQNTILIPQNIAQFMIERERHLNSPIVGSPNIPDTPMNSYVEQIYPYHRELDTLFEMGFTDSRRLHGLLDEYHGDIEMVTASLLDAMTI